MKFNCGMTYGEKFEAQTRKYTNWHLHFAWRPVRLGSRDCRWLEFVWRKYERINYYSLEPTGTIEYREFKGGKEFSVPQD